MKFKKRFVSICALVCFGALLGHAGPIGDFKSSGFSYGYEGWKELASVQTLGEEGAVIKGPAAGGAGLFLNETLDLSSALRLEIKLKVLPGNTAATVIVKIPDVKEWTVDLTKYSDGKVVTVPLAMDDTARKAASKVQNIQLQGTFSPEETVAVIIFGLTAISPEKAK